MVAKLSKLVGRAAAIAALPALLALTASSARAQQGAVTGQVVDAQSAQPAVGAQVTIQGTQLGALTDESGRYRITGVPTGRQIVLQVRLLGYALSNRQVRVPSGETVTVNFELRPRAITLEELVVTGTAAQTMRAKVPFDVSSIADEQMPVPSSTAGGMLQGKVAGVTVTSGTGRPGSDPSVLLRGATSINASGRNQEPLYIVDGVIMNDLTGLADLGSLDIKNIEVVKGAAAASLYGSRAANGVIQITTQDGAELQDGTVDYTMRTEYGQSELEGSFFLPQHHEFALTDDGSAIVQGSGLDPCVQFTACSAPLLAGNAAWRDPANAPSAWNTVMSNPWPGQTYDQVDLAMSDGNFSESYVSVSGHSGGTNFHASFAYTDEEGVMPGRDGFQRYNVRLNVDQRIQEELSVSASAFYSTSTQDNFFENSGNPMFDLTRMKSGVNLRGCVDDVTRDCFDKPDSLILVADPTNTESPNPLYQMLVQETQQDRGRFLGSADIEYSPLDWLSIQGNISYDRLDHEYDNFYPKGYRTIDASALNDGFLSKEDHLHEALNTSVTANLNFQLTENISNTTKLRYLYEREENLINSASGLNFAVADVPTLGNLQDQASLDVTSSSLPVRSDGYFLITNFDIQDRYIVDALARNDGSSLFGPDQRRHWYYRVAGAWRMTQEDWFDVEAVDELKLRYSYGTAGGRPNFSAQYETYSVGGGRVTLGNTELEPEFSQEHEAGLDAILFDRFVLGATYAHTVTDNQILPVPLPSFSGFATQWKNAGELTSKTWEVSLQANVLETEDFSWSARATWDRTRSEITQLDVPAFRYGVAGQGLGNVFYAREGEEMGTFYGAAFARDCGDLPEGVSCDGFTVNDDGFLVWVGDGSLSDNAWGSSSDVNVRGGPVMWGTPFQGECTDRESGERTLFCPVGNTMPDYSVSLSNTFNYKGLSVYALLHAEQGFDVYNQPLEWAVFRRNAGIYDEAGTPAEQQKPLGYYDAWYGGANGLAPDDEWVEDGSYVKLREVSARYRFDAEQLDAVPGLSAFTGLAVTLTGRNLITWTDYRGFDPEVGKDGGVTGSATLARVAGYQYPNFRTFTAGIELTF